MRGQKSRVIWVGLLLIFGTGWLIACGAAHPRKDDALVSDVRASSDPDPFDDPFFTNPPDWDKDVLAHSELMVKWDDEISTLDDSDESETTLEKGENILFTGAVVGATIAKMMFIPFVGF